MGEITRHNYEEKYPGIVMNLKRSLFVALDTEFSGLLSDPEFKPSLFDTGKERYDKLRRSIEHFLIMEIGLTFFHLDENEYRFEANKYTFYICPQSFASIDNKFMCQSSSLEFLCQHNFDFNKFAYGGISYLNQQQENDLRKELKEGSLFRNLERTISLEDEKLVQSHCSRVAEWVASAVLGDVMCVEDVDTIHGVKRLAYILHKELRQRFPNIWTYPDGRRIRIEKISQGQRNKLEENKGRFTSLEEDMMDSLLGFSRLFKLLIQLKKPIVGHNLLLDLMIMYNQFHEQLPAQLDVFKEKINSMFPLIYDTKFLSFELKSLVRREDMWESNILKQLYYFFKEGRGKYIVLFSPAIKLKNESDIPDSEMEFSESDTKASQLSQEDDVKFHDAGWDSFCTGYCFVRMAHIFSHIVIGKLVEGRPLSSREFLCGIASRKNCVNVIRAGVSHLCLDGRDPVSSRPRWLHVQAKGFQPIDISKVAELFARFGAVDVKPFTKYRALVAVGNHGSTRDILRQFQKHKDFRVSYYHPLRHSPIVNAVLWSGLCVSGGICAYLLYKNLNRIQTPVLR